MSSYCTASDHLHSPSPRVFLYSDGRPLMVLINLHWCDQPLWRYQRRLYRLQVWKPLPWLRNQVDEITPQLIFKRVQQRRLVPPHFSDRSQLRQSSTRVTHTSHGFSSLQRLCSPSRRSFDFAFSSPPEVRSVKLLNRKSEGGSSWGTYYDSVMENHLAQRA